MIFCKKCKKSSKSIKSFYYHWYRHHKGSARNMWTKKGGKADVKRINLPELKYVDVNIVLRIPLTVGNVEILEFKNEDQNEN